MRMTQHTREELAAGSDIVTKVQRYKWRDNTKPGKMSYIDKSIILVDDEYQRDTYENKIVTIASNFSWPAFGVLIVARRKEHLFCVDGQHRLLAAKKRADVRTVPCIIFDSYGQEHEAKVFLESNTNRKALTSFAKFDALLMVKDKAAMLVKELVDASGRVISMNAGPNNLSCISGMIRLAQSSEETLRKVWPLVCDVCQGGVLHEMVLSSLVYIEQRMPDGQSLTDKRWGSRVRSIGGPQIIKAAQAASAYYARGGAKVWAEGVVNRINKNVAESKHLALRPDA